MGRHCGAQAAFHARASRFAGVLRDPKGLDILDASFGLGHRLLDMTMPRFVIFRDAIMDLFAVGGELRGALLGLPRTPKIAVPRSADYVKAPGAGRDAGHLAALLVHQCGGPGELRHGDQGHPRDPRGPRQVLSCGSDELLHRHPDIVQIFLWRRSDFTTIGMRAGTTPCSTCLSTRAAAS